MADKSKLTPVMQQYVDMKSENPDALLMFRLGDFYESFFEDAKIYREKKNQTNRLNNCEQANMDRVFQTATSQLAQIEVIEESGNIDLLDDKTKEALLYRKKYPESSLKELSEIISLETGKTITKSGLNHRFRKIKELAENLKKI